MPPANYQLQSLHTAARPPPCGILSLPICHSDRVASEQYSLTAFEAPAPILTDIYAAFSAGCDWPAIPSAAENWSVGACPDSVICCDRSFGGPTSTAAAQWTIADDWMYAVLDDSAWKAVTDSVWRPWTPVEASSKRDAPGFGWARLKNAVSNQSFSETQDGSTPPLSMTRKYSE